MKKYRTHKVFSWKDTLLVSNRKTSHYLISVPSKAVKDFGIKKDTKLKIVIEIED